MEHLLGRDFTSLNSRYGFIKGERLKLIDTSLTEMVFQKVDGSTVMIDAKNKKLIETGNHTLTIFEPLCREPNLIEMKHIRKVNRLCGSQLAKSKFRTSKILWTVHEYLKNNNVPYLLGEFSDAELKYKDNMIYDYQIKGEVKIKFVPYHVQQNKIKSWAIRKNLGLMHKNRDWLINFYKGLFIRKY